MGTRLVDTGGVMMLAEKYSANNQVPEVKIDKIL